VHGFSSYWKERLGAEMNKAMTAVAQDDRKGKKEGSKVKKVDAKHDIS